MHLSPRLFRFLLNCYPPYFGAGIRVLAISDDWRSLLVTMGLRWYNKNAVGVQFGGSLYAMVDPHLMLMYMQLLGREYIVWDKSAAIRFIAPGRGRVWADFSLTAEDIKRVEDRTGNRQVFTPVHTISIYDEENRTVAEVEKEIYIRRKRGKRRES